MALLKVHKFVSALPGTLEANALYFVRVGTGFDLYATNDSGTIVAYTMNAAGAPINSPAFTGSPTAPVLSFGQGTNPSIATQGWSLSMVNYQLSNYVASSSLGPAIDFARPKGLSGSCAGKPAANEMVCGDIAPYAFTLSAANSRARALTKAAASTVFIIKREGTQIGTITFSTDATSGVFSYSSTAITVDQNLTVHAPATPDATLADLSFLLRA